MNRILAGTRIIESSAFIAAPYAGMMLAQAGAEVIRVDTPGGGLDYRRWPVTSGGTSLYWAGLNKAKRSVCIDIRKAEGRELLAKLVTARDEEGGLLLTNLPLRAPFDLEDLRAMRTDVIVTSIVGSRSGRNAVDYTVNASTGFPLLTGSATNGGPVNSVIPAWDLLAGASAAFALLAAVSHRRASGEGQLVQLTLEDIALSTLGHLGYIAEAQINQVERPRLGNDIYGTFGRDFQSRDNQRLMLVAFTPKQWQALATATGLHARLGTLAQALDLDFNKEGDRFKGRAAIALLLEEWVGSHSTEEIDTVFHGTGVCYGWYRSVLDLVDKDIHQLETNPLFSSIEQSGIGKYLMPGSVFDFEASPRQPTSPAPILGADTQSVLSEVLGLSNKQFEALLEREVVAGPTGTER